MRYIPINELIARMCSLPEGAEERSRLFRSHKKVARMAPPLRQGYIRRNGPGKWTPIKRRLTAALGNKCWYTEVELVGAPLAIDHFRPICDYWWLAFDVENYRVACPYSNSPEHNKEHGCAGGKGDKFPLLGSGTRATGKNRLRLEKPLILDPCRKEDCDLVAFQVDGRPVLNPAYASDPIALRRVEESKILLNLDHPDFNSKREQLCNDIEREVRMYEALDEGTAARSAVISQLEQRLSPTSPFSSAARYYLRLHRDLSWVEELLERV
jgi:hypothetical protein